jgi:hypothetical protein
MAEIGQKTDVHCGRTEQETDRVLGIMRDGEGFDSHIAELERATGLEVAPDKRQSRLATDGLTGEAIAVDGNAELGGDLA